MAQPGREIVGMAVDEGGERPLNALRTGDCAEFPETSSDRRRRTLGATSPALVPEGEQRRDECGWLFMLWSGPTQMAIDPDVSLARVFREAAAELGQCGGFGVVQVASQQPLQVGDEGLDPGLTIRLQHFRSPVALS